MRSLGAGRPTIAANRDHLEPWRQAVAAAATQAIAAGPMLAGPLELRATFVFRRPAAHYGTGRNAGKVKLSAPALVSTRPDLDKLVRAIGDALTGIIYRDDAQLAVVRAEKHYGIPCAHLVVVELD
jgi:Holliday junction resolvase RusA-like endonuclease